MLFKNATIVQITGDIPVSAEAIEAALKPHAYVPARPMESERYGWVPPTDIAEDSLVRPQGNVFLLSLKIETKILPASVIKEELRERMAVRGAAGRKLRAKERQQMIDEIRFDLLPKAFSKYDRILGYIDAQRREIIIGTASANRADEFLSCLRTAFGTLPVQLVEPDYAPQVRMTEWATKAKAPAKVQFGQEISLEDPKEGGKGAFRKQDLTSEEILQCIHSGKRVQRISLSWNDYLSFSVDDRLVLRKLRTLDTFEDEHEFESDDEVHAKLDADLFMTFTGLRRLVPEIYKWFDVMPLEGQADEAEAGLDEDAEPYIPASVSPEVEFEYPENSYMVDDTMGEPQHV